MFRALRALRIFKLVKVAVRGRVRVRARARARARAAHLQAGQGGQKRHTPTLALALTPSLTCNPDLVKVVNNVRMPQVFEEVLDG